MNVILLEKIGKLGEIGDTTSVKAGYARNYLFPFGKAIPATKDNLADFESRRSELLAAHDQKVAEAQTRAAKVANANITIEVNASDEGRLFGSVSTRDIAEQVNSDTGGDVAKSEVQLPEAIRETGEYEITLDFGYDVSTLIKVAVVSDGAPLQTLDDEEADSADEVASEANEESAESEGA